MKHKKNKKSICVITMTYNRPEYLEKSIVSLYKKAGRSFDHYVFDDFSDDKTYSILKKMQNKYKFKLFRNTERLGLYKNFHKNIKNIEKRYDYYLKHDSDIELLSNNIFNEMLEVSDFPLVVSAITTRLEGIRNVDRYDCRMNFYNGHAIKYDSPVVYGCFMLIKGEVFDTFTRLSNQDIENSSSKWGIDSEIYQHVKKAGHFLIVEDLSIYHIDNAYGQRKNNPGYFTDRNRWKGSDVDETILLQASKNLQHFFIDRKIYDEIINESNSAKEFNKYCKEYAKTGKMKIDSGETITTISVRKEKLRKTTEAKPLKEVFRISAPLNFAGRSLYMQKGETRVFTQLPEWAKNDPSLVIEKIKVAE
jgi:glycosyltransferase involved in cell wall biosynthesis